MTSERPDPAEVAAVRCCDICEKAGVVNHGFRSEWIYDFMPIIREALAEQAKDREQIGWFDPGSKRFAYCDVKEGYPDNHEGYTIPVYIEKVTSSAEAARGK